MAGALGLAASGPVIEGAVGGGTGMICHLFKCGTGTASRRAIVAGATYTVEVTCLKGDTASLTFTGDGTQSAGQIPEGDTCTVTETADAMFTMVFEGCRVPKENILGKVVPMLESRVRNFYEVVEP